MAVAAVFGAAVMGGVITGIVLGIISAWFSLFVVFPMLAGAGAAAAAAWMIGKHKLRAPMLALALGALGGTTAYLAVHAVGYLQFRAGALEAIHADDPTLGDDQASIELDRALEQEVGHAGVVGWLELAARRGISIKRIGSDRNDGTFTGGAAYVIWLLELLVATGMAGFIARHRANEPFCEACDRWFGAERAIAQGGSGSKADGKRIIRALEAGDLRDAATTFTSGRKPGSNFVLSARTCSHCEAEWACTLTVAGAERKATEVRKVKSWLFTRDEAARFIEAIASASPK
ncbi:MAG: hypothetical protein AB7P03_30020 [Kofleriaceae bacterium]